ncbi:MAG: hypothetical protein R2830_13925 [Saprospiraceae bacterium]
MIFANDINERIKKDFDLTQREEVIMLFENNLKRGMNVGEGQFLRSLLFIANGNIEKLKRELSHLRDPRDIVMKAERTSGGLGHWFTIPFDEIELLNEKVKEGGN